MCVCVCVCVCVSARKRVFLYVCARMSARALIHMFTGPWSRCDKAVGCLS